MALAHAIDIEAEVSDMEGDATGAEWHRSRAAVYRSNHGAAETARSHRAYIVMAATHHVSHGAPIDPAHEAEIRAEAERIRAEVA